MQDLDAKAAPPHVEYNIPRTSQQGRYKCLTCGGSRGQNSNQCKICWTRYRRLPEDHEIYNIGGESCRRLPITGRLYTLVPTDLYEDLLRFPWRKSQQTNYLVTYAVADLHTKGNISSNGRVIFKAEPLHRYICKELVDHINRMGLDNRRSNLRPCTVEQNQRNMGLRRDSSTGLVGVKVTGQLKRYNCKKPYIAVVNHKGKRIHAGCFEDPLSAAYARDRLACELHGDFAYINFPEFISESYCQWQLELRESARIAQGLCDPESLSLLALA